MSQTVIGIFGSDPAAEAAVEHVVSSGIPHSSVNVYSHPSQIDAMEKAVVGPDGVARHQHESLLDKIERFFATLVGDDDRPPEFYHYRDVVRRGGALVCVNVDDDSLLPIIFTIFETSGALDIDEHLAQWKSETATDTEQSVQVAPDALPEEATASTSRRAQPYQVFARRKGADAASSSHEPEHQSDPSSARASDAG